MGKSSRVALNGIKNYPPVSAVLRELRLNAGLTQEQLGFESELRRTYISILELGHQQPTLTTILKLAKALNRPANELISLVETELLTARRRSVQR